MSRLTFETSQNTAVRKFSDCMQHGDDFFKIELLRHAKNWYSKALDFNLETVTVHQRIAECDRLLAFERKVAGILAVVAILITAVCFIIWN